MNLELVLFLTLAVAAVTSAILMITRRNPVTSALYLVFNFFVIAVLYLMLRAQFIAVIQITVYAGAIMVLFLFVIMLLNLGEDKLAKWKLTSAKSIAALLGVALLIEILYFAISFTSSSPMPRKAESMGTIEAIGQVLFSKYVFPFEMTSILLLAAIVGAILLAKKNLNDKA